MSGNMDPPKDSKEQRKKPERDVSPSAYSQSSAGLEWDPTADGTFHQDIRHRFRSLSMVELGLRDSTTAPTASTGSDPSKYRLSDFSPDRSKSKPSQIMDHSSGISEWLEVGMTRSELEFRKKREKADSERSSSLIFVEVQQNFDLKSAPDGSEEIVKNVGVQTSDTLRHSGEISGEVSSIYHSTPTDHHNKGRFSSNDKSSSQSYSAKKNRRRGRSPPQPFAVASRKSSHYHHRANHSRNHDTEFSSLTDSSTTKESSEQRVRGTSSSELSPSCFLIDNVTKSAKSPIKKHDIVNALEVHRDYHIKKVRHELRQLDRLNQLLSRNLSSKHYRRQYNKSEVQTDDEPGPNRSRKKSPLKSKSLKKEVPSAPVKSHLSTSTATTPKDSTNKSTLSDVTRAKSDNQRPSKSVPKSKESLEKKLDELMDAFSMIAGMLIEKKSDQEQEPSDNSSGESSKKSSSAEIKEPEPVKQSVAYFIPFPNYHGRYSFTQDDIDYFKGRQPKPIIDTQTRTASRQAAQHLEQDDDDSSGEEEVDENRDPCHEEGLAEHYCLQDVFQRRCPNFLKRLRQREAILARIKTEREMRAEKKREWIRLYGDYPGCLRELNSMLPPKGPRLMTTKEMRMITERHYKRLPEVQEKVLQIKVAEEKKTNRIMSQVFAQNLRKGALKGEVNFAHSRSLLRR